MVKEFDPEDPEELVGVAIPGGDTDQQLECIVQEYLLMGWAFQQIMVLFRSPHYAATHQIYRQKGEGYIKDRVHQLVSQWRQGWRQGWRQDSRPDSMDGRIQNQPQSEAPYA